VDRVMATIGGSESAVQCSVTFQCRRSLGLFSCRIVDARVCCT
jgi:hypothetical protein